MDEQTYTQDQQMQDAMMAQQEYGIEDEQRGSNIPKVVGAVAGGAVAGGLVHKHLQTKASNIANPMKGSAEEIIEKSLKLEEAKNNFHNKYLNDADGFRAVEDIYSEADKAKEAFKNASNGSDANQIESTKKQWHDASKARAELNEVVGLAGNTSKFDAQHFQKMQDLTGAKSYDSTLVTDRYNELFHDVNNKTFMSDKELKNFTDGKTKELKDLVKPDRKLGSELRDIYDAKKVHLEDTIKHAEANHKFNKLQASWEELAEGKTITDAESLSLKGKAGVINTENALQRSSSKLINLTHGEQIKEALDPLKSAESTVEEVANEGKGLLKNLKGSKVTGGAVAAVAAGALVGGYALNKMFGNNRQHMTHAQRYQQQAAMGQQQPQMG